MRKNENDHRQDQALLRRLPASALAVSDGETPGAEITKRHAGLIQSLLDSIPDIIFHKDLNGVYLGCNPPFAEFVGRPRDEILGSTDFDLFDKTIAESFREHDQRMLASGVALHNEEWITYPDGREILIDTLKTPYVDLDGKLNGVLGISRDITARKQAEAALRESEANFRTFFETITDMILVSTPDGRILFANAAVTRLLGYPADELKGMHLLDVHPANKRQEAEEIFAAMFRGERESCPLPLVRKDGGLVPVDTRVWFGKWNGVDCLFGVCKNLTEEQEAKQRFERLFRSNPSVMAVSSLPEHRYVDVNDAFLHTLGYASEEVVGKVSTDLALFVQPDRHAAAAAELKANGRLADCEMQVRRKDGAILDGIFSGELISSQGRQYLLTVMVNITARKRAETELARLAAIQRKLMDLATDFVNVPTERQDAAIDESLATMGQLIAADRAYLFAYDFDAGIMSNTHEWCRPGIPPEIGNLQAVPLAMLPDWVAAHQAGQAVHIPSVAALPVDGFSRQVLEPQGIRSLVTLPLMQGGVCLGFVGFDAVRETRVWRQEEVALLRVLAELYANFEARRASERQAAELQQHLIHARDAAQAAALAKSLFLANMSHEIRTPLNAILGYAQIMQRDCEVCPSGGRLRAITRSGEHLLELLTDLLELVRNDVHKISLTPCDFDIYQVLEDVRLMFVRHAQAQGLTLEFTHSPEVPQFVHTDPGKVRQILVNLVGNALKFTAKGGVRVAAAVLPGSEPGRHVVVVEVADTGCGLGDDELERVFDIFEQAQQGRKSGKGVGLGLPLSRRYAQALGGDVTASSRLGEGSRFRFTFKVQEVGEGGVEQLRRGNVLHLAAGQPACRLLVVDDEPENRDMLSAMLTAAGFAVEAVASAAHALERLRQRPAVDLVLMDKRLPEMDGYEAIGRLRELPGVQPVAVVVVTASGAADEKDLALAAGADGYVSKPVRREGLLAEISRVVGVHYDHEPVPRAAAPQAVPRLDAAALGCLSSAQRQLLDQALHRGDIQQLRQVLAGIDPAHAGVAAGMQVLVDAYDYGRLRDLLDQTPEAIL